MSYPRRRAAHRGAPFLSRPPVGLSLRNFGSGWTRIRAPKSGSGTSVPRRSTAVNTSLQGRGPEGSIQNGCGSRLIGAGPHPFESQPKTSWRSLVRRRLWRGRRAKCPISVLSRAPPLIHHTCHVACTLEPLPPVAAAAPRDCRWSRRSDLTTYLTQAKQKGNQRVAEGS